MSRAPSPHTTAARASARPHFALVTGIFFLSGAAGLVYQVLWMRSLGLFFGSDMYGVSIILGTFMAGLALGSWLGGGLAERTPRPLVWYGAAEIGIGALALALPSLLAALDPLLHGLYDARAAGSEAPLLYQAVRIAFATAALLLPTTLMGATLPLIMKHFVRERAVLGQLGAFFYAVNTFGAFAGTLTAGFLLLPNLGMQRTTWTAAAINLGIGFACAALGFRASGEATNAAPSERRSSDVPDGDPLPGLESRQRLVMARAALVAFGLSGFASFAFEVVWTRILLISFSATVYSFATTLGCFLLGIVLGTHAVSRVVDGHRNPLGLLAGLELATGTAVGAVGLLLYAVPGLFGRLLSALAGSQWVGPEQALVVATLLASFPLLVVPASLLGATFPVALRVYTTNVAHVGSRTGNIYAANTLGAVLGSLSGGLVLLPTIGAYASLALVALLFVAIGAGLAGVRTGAGERALPLRPVAAATAMTIAMCAGALLLPTRVVLNFDQKTLAGAEILHHSEGIQNTIDVVRTETGATSLIIGGNVEADDGLRQRRHFVLKGHLPLMLMDAPRRVLVVGLGMGITLQATARHPGLERIDVIELSPDIVAAQAALGDVNGNVLEHPLVHVRIDDGRLFMKLTNERFDMITADPIHPKISRVGYLYTREYYESIREHLEPGGVVCQWMPIYQISPTRLRSAIKTFQEVFGGATLWHVEGHALLVARRDEAAIDFRRLARRFADPAVREDLASIGIASPEALLSHLVMGPEALQAYVAAEPGVPTNTDDFPYLEYHVPRDLFRSSAENVREWLPYLSDPAGLAQGLSAAEAVRVRSLALEHRRRMTERARDGA